MKLYVVNRLGQKVVLDIVAKTRNELAFKIGYNFQVHGEEYSVQDVKAEASNNDTAGGALLGGFLGLLGGGVGVLVGGLAGGIIGGIRDEQENQEIKNFNRS